MHTQGKKAPTPNNCTASFWVFFLVWRVVLFFDRIMNNQPFLPIIYGIEAILFIRKCG